MKALMSKWIHSSPPLCLIKCASATEVPHHAIVTFLSWLMEFIFSLVVFPYLLNQRRVKSVASCCLVVEGDGL